MNDATITERLEYLEQWVRCEELGREWGRLMRGDTTDKALGRIIEIERELKRLGKHETPSSR